MKKKMPSSNAFDRPISVWFQKIQNGEIKLPRFQRHQAWDKNKICSLLDTIIQNLPLGVTLLLIVDEEQFISRYLVTAPETNARVTEHLLDGQQRLTALWRTFHNNYESDKYFVYMGKHDVYWYEDPDKDEVSIYRQGRWWNKNGTIMPLWADSPEKTLMRGLIPMELFRPGDTGDECQRWVNEAMEQYRPAKDDNDYEKIFEKWMTDKSQLLNEIRDIRETITHFNLPFLSLPSSTSKEIALKVFINMNTNSKPLSQYDIIRAEIEEVVGRSLDDLENKLNKEVPNVHHYQRLSQLILSTSALIQNKLPNQRGAWNMNKEDMVSNWQKLERGLAGMVQLLEEEGIYDRARLPTNAVLAVIATLYNYEPSQVDEKGVFKKLLKKYLWTAFFTNRYENSAATHAYNDFMNLKKVVLKENKVDGSAFSEKDVQIFNKEKYPIADIDELMKVGWPKRENIRARAIMAVFYKLGAFDFADGSRLQRQQLLDGKRHYHHIFPASILKVLDVDANLTLNCALISDKTNLDISNKEPLLYLKERYEWMDQDVVNERLLSHLIPIKELANGGYEDLEVEERMTKLKKDYLAFVQRRASYVKAAIELLVEGKDISLNKVLQNLK